MSLENLKVIKMYGEKNFEEIFLKLLNRKMMKLKRDVKENLKSNDIEKVTIDPSESAIKNGD